MTAPARFRQCDIKRAAAGVRAAGLDIGRIEIDLTGRIVIVPAGQPQAGNDDEWGDLA